MILYLMKNNFKLMMRNKLAIIVLLIGPLLCIAMLSTSFNSLMQSYEAPDKFTVGYRETDSFLSGSMDTVKEAGREAGIVFSEYPEGDPSELIANNSLSAFIEFGSGDYRLYKSSDHKPEGAVTEYFLERVMSKSADAVLDTMSPGGKMTSALDVTELEYMPAVNSTDYYGIIYLVFFFSLGMICATGVLSSEKKNDIEKKYQVCSLSSGKLYLARLIPAAGVMLVCLIIEITVTTAMFDIHWGSPMISALILVLTIIAGASFGFMMYSISHNLAITVISLFMVFWVMGFIGGSFETYMYSSFPDNIKAISPLYHVNRALVELSCMGHSDHTSSALIYTSAAIAVCSLTAIVSDMLRRRGKA